MRGELLALAVVAVLVVFAVLVTWLRGGPAVGDQDGLPGELRGAELVFAEQTFRSAQRRLVARVDRAYRAEGILHMVELKTRPRDAAYMADVIELSAQRIAVQDQTGEPVSPDGWVIVQHSETGRRRPHQVRLLSAGDVAALSDRYQALQRGEIKSPTAAKSPRQCKQCGHRDRCFVGGQLPSVASRSTAGRVRSAPTLE